MDGNPNLETQLFDVIITNSDCEYDYDEELRYQRQKAREFSAMRRREKQEELEALFVLDELAVPRNSLTNKRNVFLRDLLALDLHLAVLLTAQRMPTTKEKRLIKQIATAKLEALKLASRPRDDCYSKINNVAVEKYRELQSKVKELEHLVAQSVRRKFIAG